MTLSLMPSRCLVPTCRAALVTSAGEQLVCSRCAVRVREGAQTAAKFGAHVGAAAVGDVLRREFPDTFRTLAAGFRSWKAAEAKRDATPGAGGDRTVVDFGAAQRRKAGT